ncbi:MAG: hypothetical protein F6J87_08435 [Spirulina sp. SIO3F2]|nr:hypothetical protein [Spirulina sp. SIO3F2]
MGDFTRSLGEVLIDITALEVNTMVVERITGNKFVAWDVYRELFQIDESWEDAEHIHASLRDRYLDLRRDLELDYVLLICDPNSELFDPTTQSRGVSQQERLQILRDAKAPIDSTNTQLPNPLAVDNADELHKVQQLLNNSRFSRILRKMNELKAGLDNRNRALLRMQHLHPGMSEAEHSQAIATDIIYAQTVIQLDGDVINRYSQEILEHPQRDLILDIHRNSVTAGEEQWRELLGFILDLAQKAFSQVGNALAGGRKRR